MAVDSALTRDQMMALFARRQEAFDNMDADALVIGRAGGVGRVGIVG